MVFESIVVDVINRLVGDYFENLDTSQLQLGIWGGNVVLRELLIKHSAMDDLGVPFKVVVGKVGSLTLKIPWASLYTSPVELNLQDLFLLVTPSYSVKYDEQAEEKAMQSSKQAQLARIDQARLREKDKKKEEVVDAAKQDSFTEKLITQIIKNVQIRINCIHIRYEDAVTKPRSPFGFGVILKSLHVETADANWIPKIISDMVHTVNKLAILEGLSVYWNSDTTLLQSESKKSVMIAGLKNLVEVESDDLTYILGPITSTAKVLLTPNPDRLKPAFSKPKISVDILMEQLGLGMTSLQFQDIMELIEALEFMARAQHYRKYRPASPEHKGHYREWWKFAYRCIVEEDIRRKKQNWDWQHIERHRNLCRTYSEAYYKKLTDKKLTAAVLQSLHACEKELDLFNITLVRKQVEFQVEKEGKQAEEAAKKGGGGGWFSSWWFGGDADSKPTGSGSIGDIAEKFQKAMTSEEKAKLYAAIDYTENALPLDFPETYEEIDMNFHLNKLVFTVQDANETDKKGQLILNLQVSNVGTTIKTRPIKKGLKVDVEMESLEAEGMTDLFHKTPVKIVTSKMSQGSNNLLVVSFENNPLNNQANQKIKVRGEPIEVLYHGPTVIHLAKCFALPPEMRLSKLQAAAMSTINEWREQSASGLQHLIETRGEISIDIHLLAPYFVIPQGGQMNPGKCSVLTVDLGELKIRSVPRKKHTGDLYSIGKENLSDEQYVNAMKKFAYDTINIDLQDFGVFLSLPGENYSQAVLKIQNADLNHVTPQALIRSNNLQMQLDHSLIPDDRRFSKLKLEGNLPLLNLNISQNRLTVLVTLVLTLPFPESEVPYDVVVGGPANTMLETIAEDPTVAESYAISKITYGKIIHKPKPSIEFTDLVIKFTVYSIKIRVTTLSESKEVLPFVDFEMKELQGQLIKKTFSTGIDLAIGGLTLCALQNKVPGGKGPLYLLKTPMTEGINKHLFKLHVFSISPDCPPALTTEIKQRLEVDVSSLDVILHYEALQSIIKLGEQIATSAQIASTASKMGISTVVRGSKSPDRESVDSHSSSASNRSRATRQFSRRISRIEATRRAVAKKVTDPNDIILQIDAKMDSLTVQLSYEKQNIIMAILRKLEFSMVQRLGRNVIFMDLCNLEVLNLNPYSIYKKVLAVDSDKVVSIHVVMLEDGTSGPAFLDMDKHDMSVKIETGSPKIFYFAKIINEVLAFVNDFATAREAVLDASAAAAAAAKGNMEHAYKSAKRIVIDIILNAPVIYIPRNETSQQGLLADLGILTLRNRFVKTFVSQLSTPAIMDTMDINLTNMRLSRIHYDPARLTFQSEVLILDPVSFKLTMERNLSMDWYHEVPNIHLVGTLRKTHIRASNEDYDVLMATLMENIAYKPPEDPAVAKASKPRKEEEALTAKGKMQLAAASVVAGRGSGSSSPTHNKGPLNMKSVVDALEELKATDSDTSITDPSSIETIVPPQPEPEPVFPTIKVELYFPSLRVIMYQKGTLRLDEHAGRVERQQSTGFADFMIVNVRVKFETWTNGSMICPITLEDVTLKDIRPGKRAVMNLIQRKIFLTEEGLEQEMTEKVLARFNFTVEVDENLVKTMMLLETTSITIVLCLDYLLQIIDFFSRPENPDAVKPDLKTKHEKFPIMGDPKPIREATTEKSEVAVGLEVPDADKSPEQFFKGLYNFNETEIILVESMESVSSNALLLHCEVSLNQSTVSGRSNMMGVVDNFKLCTCRYNIDNRHENVAEVISPTAINLIMNQSEASGTMIDVNISDIFIRMTAGTLELLLKIMGTVNIVTSGSEPEKEKKDYSDLWLEKKVDGQNYWFLNPDASVEVGLEALKEQEDRADLYRNTLKINQRLIMESGAIVFTFETGMGTNTMPMLLVETDIDLQVFDWTTNLAMQGRMKLEAAYYNATYGLWEFLVEPIETKHHGKIAHQPWEILVEYSSRANPLAGQSGEDELPTVIGRSYISIALESTELIELTVTRTALEVVEILRDDFQAATKNLVSQKAVSTAAYCIYNDTGMDIILHVKEKGIPTSFTLYKEGFEYEQCLLKAGTSVNLTLIESSDQTKHHASVLREQEGKEERMLTVEVPDYGFKRQIPVNRACQRYYPLQKRHHGHIGLICDIWVKDCSKIVSIRGVVQIMNDLKVDVDVYYKDDSGTCAILAGTAQSGQKFNFPIPNTYTRTGEIFFAPFGFSISTESFSWNVALKEVKKIAELRCESLKPDAGGKTRNFFMKVIGEAKQALHESTNRKNLVSQCCYIYLEPPLLVNNLLPVSIGVIAHHVNSKMHVAGKGSTINVTDVRVSEGGCCSLTMRILNYHGTSWASIIEYLPNTPDLTHWAFKSESERSEVLTVGIHREKVENEITWHVYIPYWMINRTGVDLVYRGNDRSSIQVQHPKKMEDPILFSFPGKAFFSKKDACVKVKDFKLPIEGTDWSEKFSIDVAGSSGSVKCKSPLHSYQLGVEIQLSSWGLTKYVIFTPRFFLVNQCTFLVSVKEAEKPDHVIPVDPNSCIPFWPESTDARLIATLHSKRAKSQETKAFRYDCVRHTLLQLNNCHGGLHVDIHFSDQKTVITFSEFVPGQAPVLLVNGTKDCKIEISEQGLTDVFILKPRMCKLFTWKEPVGERTLLWSSVGAEKKPQGKDKLYSDGFGTFTFRSVRGETTYYWISFLDGLQRVLLFTYDVELASYLQAARENEVATAEYIFMLQGIGISLVDNQALKELLYIRIASSEIIWEICKPGKHKRFKPLDLLDSSYIEVAYQNHLNQKLLSENISSKIALDTGMKLDFEAMKMIKPYDRTIRRTFQTGIWLHYKTLPNSTQFHAKIHRLQIDNQMRDAVFRVVFAPVPPPKSIMKVDFTKPFAELSVMQRINAHSYVQQFKYFKVLVQEFHVKLDIMLVNALVEMFSGNSSARLENMEKKFNAELQEASVTAKEFLTRQIVNQGQKHFFDFLHFSPLKIHISFSMSGSAQMSSHFLNLILASVGVTLTEIQDVVFKLSCMELQHSFISGDQLYNEVYSHYTSQAIKQLYVLVLGLDVLGNPYGLVAGVASGVEAFFYEPIQGAIQGPGEFAEGLALGVKTLLGSTVGGAAGAFSKITGTLGKGIAVLTFDDEFQQKRRQQLLQHGDAAEGLARSGKGLVMGFVDGVTGLVTKPMTGAREEGVGGFFKGMGKGAIGLFVRPATGIVDFTSGSFEAVKKAASMTEEVGRMRPPRCVPPDNVIQPYVKHEAEGVNLLKTLFKGKYSKTDTYVAHALINPSGFFVLLLTNKRLIYVSKNDIFGGWREEWVFIWEDFATPPDIVEKGLLFRLKAPPSRKQRVNSRGLGSKEYTLTVHSAGVCTWLLSKIEEAMRHETGVMFRDGADEATEDTVNSN